MNFPKLNNLYGRLIVLQLTLISTLAHGMDHKRSTSDNGMEPLHKRQCSAPTQPHQTDLVFQTPDSVQHEASFLSTQDFGRLGQVNQQIHQMTNDLELAQLVKLFIQDYRDPIRKVLTISQGHDWIDLYGQTIGTGRLIRELLSAGAQLTRIGNYEKKHIYFKGEELFILTRPKFRRDNPEALKALLKKHEINAFSDIDLLPWHEAQVDPTPQQVADVTRQFPGEGVAITLTHGDIAQGWVQELVESGAAPFVVSLTADKADRIYFPDGLESLSHFQNLRELFLFNPLTKGKYFPSELCALRELRCLVMVLTEDQPDIEIPSDIENLKNLQCLQIAGANNLSIHQKIGQLTMLRCLILQADRTLNVPRDIENLKNLRVLHLMTNAPQGLRLNEPESLGKLENLRVLLIVDPEISWNTDALANLQNLYFLHLGDFNQTCCSKVPKSIINLKKLRWFMADIDDDSQIPTAVIDWIATEIGDQTFFGNADHVATSKSEVFRLSDGHSIFMRDCRLLEALRSLNKRGVLGTKIGDWLFRLGTMISGHGQNACQISCLKDKWMLLLKGALEVVGLLNKETFRGKELVYLISLLPQFQQYLTQYKAVLQETLNLVNDHLPEEWDLINAVINHHV